MHVVCYVAEHGDSEKDRVLADYAACSYFSHDDLEPLLYYLINRGYLRASETAEPESPRQAD